MESSEAGPSQSFIPCQVPTKEPDVEISKKQWPLDSSNRKQQSHVPNTKELYEGNYIKEGEQQILCST